MITQIDEFFTKGCGRCQRFDTPDCSVQQWAGGLRDLRGICLEAGLAETVKWAHPCYMHEGRNIAIIGSFRGEFTISFFNSALMKDPQRVLERQGENTRNPNVIRFRNNVDVAAMKPVILSYLAEAMSYAKAGIKPPKEEPEFAMPDELVEALDSDPELAEAFHNLTTGRQRSYVINLNMAKKPETRISRVVKFRDRIIAGKGATER